MAFDLAARVSDPVRQLGATVLAATDERTLANQFGFIVEHKILFEDEEPAAGAK